MKRQTKRPGKTSAIKVRSVDFVVYNVNNMKRSKAFYRNLLGLPIGEEYTGFWAEYATRPSVVALCSPSKRSKWRGSTAVALAVRDVYAAVEALRQKGVKVLMEPQETGVCHMAFIADPDGNRICLHQRKDGTAG